MKKIIKLFLGVSLVFMTITSIQPIQAISNEETMLIEEQLKNKIIELYPEKFKTREDFSTMSLREVETRAGTYTRVVYNGDSRSQSDVFLGAFKGAGWATNATGYIDLETSKSVSVTYGSSTTWNCGAAVEATITYSNTTSVTHHVPASIGKICSVGIFGDVSAREYTGYIYDNYTNALLSTYIGTVRVVTGQYFDGIFHGQAVKKFYNRNYIINKAVDR